MRERIVPPGSLWAWVTGLLALPAAFVWLDPFTDGVRLAMVAMPVMTALSHLAQPFGKLDTQLLMMALAVLMVGGVRKGARWHWIASAVVAALTARLILERVPEAPSFMGVTAPLGKLRVLLTLTAAAGVVAWHVGRRRINAWLWWALAAGVSSGVIALILKVLFQRQRPAAVSGAIDATGVAAITTGKCMSFPSGDATAAFAMAVVLAAYAPRLRWPAAIVAVLVCVSRVYFGCHFFSDALGGALLGAGVAAVVLVLTRAKRELPVRQ